VYAHLDNTGQIFYIGKGTSGRAWSNDRHPLWSRYVKKHLDDVYQVKILHDNLSEEEAEEVEAKWIAQCSDTVVNWFNMDRETDFEVLDRRNSLRSVNLSLIQQAKALEKYDLEKAVSMYIQAIKAIQTYAFITYEKGLVGQLLGEEAKELGVCGEVHALDRLTLCLIKLGRSEEAAQHTDNYFALYRRDLQFGVAKRIEKRVSKALANLKKLNKGIQMGAEEPRR
jgi:tetratricopeptide (TPR) repeat protein